jgi:hypothetical protein
MDGAAFSGPLSARAALARLERTSMKVADVAGFDGQAGVENRGVQFMRSLC